MAKEKEVEVVAERKFAAPTLKALDVIIAPVVTEKTMKLQQEENKVTVKVSPKANKTEIKQAIEKIFNVKVVEISTINEKPKKKRVGRYSGLSNRSKKAIVKLAEGQTIDIG